MNSPIKRFSIKHKNVMVLFAIIAFTSIGPIFNNLPIKLIFLLGLLFVSIINYRLIKFSWKHILLYFLLFIFVITSSISSYVNETFVPLVYTFTFVIAFFSAVQLSKKEILRLVDLLTIIFKYTIILAWIGYVYSLFAPPWFSLNNPNGVQNFFYLSTFSITDSPIRASGFYDEPGAFSFFICLLVFFRTYLGYDLKTSLFLMIGGFVTQSLAHAVFFVVWLFSVLFTRESKVNLSFFNRIIITLLIVFTGFLAVQSNIFSWAIERTTTWFDNPDSAVRVRNFNNCYEKIEESNHNLIYGFGNDFANRDTSEGYSENLLTPIAIGGLMVSWPFYLFLFFCLLYPLLSFSNYSLIGIGLLILQRPYFLELPYSYCLAIIIVMFLEINNKAIDKRKIGVN